MKLWPLFPRAAEDQLPYRDSTTAPDRLGNLALLLRSDAESLAGQLPRQYLARCHSALLDVLCVPADARLWELPRYAEFCLAREQALAKRVIDLLRSYGVP